MESTESTSRLKPRGQVKNKLKLHRSPINQSKVLILIGNARHAMPRGKNDLAPYQALAGYKWQIRYFMGLITEILYPYRTTG